MTSPIEDKLDAPPAADSSEGNRRDFFKRVAAGLIGFVVGVVPFVFGLIFFFDPLARKRASGDSGGKSDSEGFINLGVTVDALPADGTPQLYKVRDDTVDAWNKFLNVEIGSVWLIRNPDSEKVVAFSTICPHMGCAVDFRAANRDFYCPCHRSTFGLDGERVNKIPPRAMDTLQVKVKDDKTVWVRYEQFRAAIPEKIPAS